MGAPEIEVILTVKQAHSYRCSKPCDLHACLAGAEGVVNNELPTARSSVGNIGRATARVDHVDAVASSGKSFWLSIDSLTRPTEPPQEQSRGHRSLY
jgi:hypothetical protein